MYEAFFNHNKNLLYCILNNEKQIHNTNMNSISELCFDITHTCNQIANLLVTILIENKITIITYEESCVVFD